MKNLSGLLARLACAAILIGSSAAAVADAEVTVVHAAPFAPTADQTAVTITANGSEVLTDFVFGEFTEPLQLPAGSYLLEVFPEGAAEPAIATEVALEDDVSYTVLAVGDGAKQDLSLWALVNDAGTPADGNLNVRVVHAAPFASDLEDTQVSIRTAAGDVVNGLVGVPFRAESGFFEIPAGNYDLKVASNDGQTNLIDPLPAELPAGADVTLIAIGDGDNRPLGVLAIPVGALPVRQPVDISANGWWASDLGGSEGFILQPIPAENRLVGTGYTYSLDGSGDPFWVTFDTCQTPAEGEGCPNAGGFDGRFGQAAVYAQSGGQPGGTQPADSELIGTVEFDIVNCSTAFARLELNDGTEVTWPLSRLVQSVPCGLDLQQTEYDLGGAANASFHELPDEQTLVRLELAGGATGRSVSHAAHIHFNSVEEGGGIALFLGPIDGLDGAPGSSEFVVDVPFEELIRFDGHINIHESNAELETILAQGNIGQNAQAAAEPGILQVIPNGQSVTYPLGAVANDGLVPDGADATATFTELNESTTLVRLELIAGPTGVPVSHVAHIHENSAEEGGNIALFLGPIDALEDAPGVSYTLLNVPFEDLAEFNGYINIHESSAELGNIIAQGNIGANAE